MHQPLIEELSRIFAALVLHDGTSYSFAGRKLPVNALAGIAVTGQDPLVTSLQNTLYQHTYSHRFTGKLVDRPASTSGTTDDLTSALSKANTSRDRWDPGWSVLQLLPSGQVAAQRHATTRLLWPGEYLAHDALGAPRPGTRLSLYWKREAAVWQPGFYFAFGEMVPDHSDETRFVRFYWHVRASAAPALLEKISAVLNRFQVPFRFKFLNNSELYGRNDAAVLYTARRHFHVVTDLLAQGYAGLRAGLDGETPLFTKALAPGLGFAEDPGNGESFGMNRCRFLAEAVVEVFGKGQQTVEARLEATERRFRDAGLSLAAPHLNSGSGEDYVCHIN